MKQELSPDSGRTSNDVYQELRSQPWESLWTSEKPRFDAGTTAYRLARVGLIRALGVVALEHGTKEQKALTRTWLLELLQDPQEKIRRYAINALPKTGGCPESEQALLALLDRTMNQRDITSLTSALEKIGGTATLARIGKHPAISDHTEQKIRAQLARRDQPAHILLDVSLKNPKGLRIHLRTRRGLESFVRDELLAHSTLRRRFKILKVSPGCVALATTCSFSLRDLYALRTFGAIHLVLGLVGKDQEQDVSSFARIIASARTRALCAELTEGTPRYRLEFMGPKMSAGKVQAVVDQAYVLNKGLLNDARESTWAIEVYREKAGYSVELRPRLSPDPRFLYRIDDVPAASHPPLAAAMAILAEQQENEIVWDPFCGSGLELIERFRLGKVESLLGTDLDAKAVDVARLNLASAFPDAKSIAIHCGDFRNYQELTDVQPGTISLMITNPPLGRRVRLRNPKALFQDLFEVAAHALRPGGRLVFANPLKLDSHDPSLQLAYRQPVDLGGFQCRLEKWIKLSP